MEAPRLLPYNTAAVIEVRLYAPGDDALATVTLATGDAKVSKDGAAEANLGTLPTETTSVGSYTVTLTAAELTAKRIRIKLVDTAPKLWDDTYVDVETYGNASSQHPNLGTVSPAAAAFLDVAISGRMATFTLPTNFSSLGINASGHISRVTLTDTATVTTTATTLTNLPAITSNWLTAAGLATDAVNEVRDAILDRVLPGNHFTPFTPGTYLQQIQDVQDNITAGVIPNQQAIDNKVTSIQAVSPDNKPTVSAGGLMSTQVYGMQTGVIVAAAIATDAKQVFRDAMKLAPTAGAAASESIDDKIDDVEVEVSDTIATDVINGVIAAMAGVPVQPRATVQGDHLDIVRADAYQSSEGTGRRIPFTKTAAETHWPTTLSSVKLTIRPTAEAIERGDAIATEKLDDVVGVITSATGSGQACYFELTATQTDDLAAGAGIYSYWVRANTGTNAATLRSGSCTVRPDQTA